jgi:NADPH2:quinone reductase
MDLVAASTVPIIFETAWGCLVSRGKLQAGETILIQAAASGVGIALVQLAKHLGATVIGTASTDEKLEWAKGYGLDHGINYETQDFVEEIKKLTGGKGVPIIIDGVGGDVFEKSFGALQPGGRILTYGVASGKRSASVLLPNLWFQNLTLMGAGSANCTREDMDEMLGLFARGELKPVVDRTWPLQEAAEAHRYIEARKVMGKVALTP